MFINAQSFIITNFYNKFILDTWKLRNLRITIYFSIWGILFLSFYYLNENYLLQMFEITPYFDLLNSTVQNYTLRSLYNIIETSESFLNSPWMHPEVLNFYKTILNEYQSLTLWLMDGKLALLIPGWEPYLPNDFWGLSAVYNLLDIPCFPLYTHGTNFLFFWGDYLDYAGKNLNHQEIVSRIKETFIDDIGLMADGLPLRPFDPIEILNIYSTASMLQIMYPNIQSELQGLQTLLEVWRIPGYMEYRL